MKIQGPSGRLVELVPVDYDAETEPFTTLVLSDGTIIKMRLNIQAIMRMDGEYDQSGGPCYVVYQSQPTIRVVKTELRGQPTIGAQPTQQNAPKETAVGYQ